MPTMIPISVRSLLLDIVLGKTVGDSRYDKDDAYEHVVPCVRHAAFGRQADTLDGETEPPVSSLIYRTIWPD